MTSDTTAPGAPATPVASAAATAPGPAAEPLDTAAADTLREKIVTALKTCYDPEIPVNIYELGLIYSIDLTTERFANVKMTLTAPACPVAGSLPGEVEAKVKSVEGVSGAKVELVWDPPWQAEMMSKLAKVMLGF